MRAFRTRQGTGQSPCGHLVSLFRQGFGGAAPDTPILQSTDGSGRSPARDRECGGPGWDFWAPEG